MLLTPSQFKKIVKKELERLDEGCGSEAGGGSKCSSCSSGGGCGCSGHDDHNDADYDIIYTSEMDHPDEIVSGYSDDLGLSVDPYDTYDVEPMHTSRPTGHVPREETLDMVEELANMTSCPKTRQALLDVVDQLEYMTGETGEDLDMDQHVALDTGDISMLPSDETMGMADQVGMIGLRPIGGG